MSINADEKLYTSEVLIDGKWKSIGPSRDEVYIYNNRDVAYTSTRKFFPNSEVRVILWKKNN